MTTFRTGMLAGLLLVGPLCGGGRCEDIPKVRGALLIAGGAVRFDNAPVWKRFIDLAGGPGAKIVVVPAASIEPERQARANVDNLCRYGARAEWVAIAPKWQAIDYKAAAKDERNVQKLRRAKGIWFIGGDQSRITQALLGTPALKAIWEAYREGAVIGGTSTKRVSGP